MEITKMSSRICQLRDCFNPAVEQLHEPDSAKCVPQGEEPLYLCSLHQRQYKNGMFTKEWLLKHRVRYIAGVEIKPVIPHCDDRGVLIEILRCDDDMFKGIQQTYITTVKQGRVKGWHYHKEQHDTFFVVSGMIKLALYDSKEGSSTHGLVNEIVMGDQNQLVVQIPPGVLHGFKGLSRGDAVILNCVSRAYDYMAPDEYRIDPYDNDIPYEWHPKDR